jgi:cobalt-zinc-cadmium efflux system protein
MAEDHAGHSHGLEDHTTTTGKHRRKLAVVLCITLSVFAIQVLGSLISGSLSLLADAGHMLSDASGVTIALLASMIAALPATATRTYGYQRAEVLGALANALLLLGVAAYILVEAIGRMANPLSVDPGSMLVVAVMGAAANLASLLILRSSRNDSLNLRGAYLEVLGDLLGSLAVIAAGIWIALTGWVAADAWASALIAVMILPRAWHLLREVLHVLLEAAPAHVDVGQVRDHLLEMDGVVGVHDIHSWTITSGVPVFSAHLVVSDELFNVAGAGTLLDKVTDCLSEHFETSHCTFQVEPESHARQEAAIHT